jgi:hypothetical protein
MTHGELAEARGIDRTSAVKLVLRNKWRKQKDNHGIVRALVPFDQARRKDMGADMGAAPGADLSRVVSALESAVAALEKQANSEAAALRERLEAAERRVIQAGSERDIAIANHNRIALEVEALRTADQARRAAGRLARIKAAWRGE